MKKLFLLLVGLTLLQPLRAQTATGLRFEENLTWEQVLAKAKAENKLIFVDCYATWCGPCKQMDQTTYSAAEVGAALNDRLICVKVQMDKTPKDSDAVKAWYDQVRAFGSDYKVTAMPTFLFFTADGKAQFVGSGYKKPADFITLAQDALNPAKQYFTRLEAYRQGHADYATLPALVEVAANLGDTAVSTMLARDYVEHYLNDLAPEKFLNKPTLAFATRYMRTTDRIFDYIYHHEEEVDKAYGPKDGYQDTVGGFSRGAVGKVIVRDEITPLVKAAGTAAPDWSAIEKRLIAKYPERGAEEVYGVEMIYFDSPPHQNYDLFAKYYTLYYTVMTHYHYSANGVAWDLFEHCSDAKALKTAVRFMEDQAKGERTNPEKMDTYANLLYKVGRAQEAIEWEGKALELATADALKRHGKPDPVFETTLAKMRRGEPTWNPS